MTDEQTGHQHNWTATLRAAVAMGAADGVATVFSTLLWQDGERISIRARAFLEQFAPSYFAEEDLSGAMLEDRLRMDMFNA